MVPDNFNGFTYVLLWCAADSLRGGQVNMFFNAALLTALSQQSLWKGWSPLIFSSTCDDDAVAHVSNFFIKSSSVEGNYIFQVFKCHWLLFITVFILFQEVEIKLRNKVFLVELVNFRYLNHSMPSHSKYNTFPCWCQGISWKKSCWNFYQICEDPLVVLQVPFFIIIDDLFIKRIFSDSMFVYFKLQQSPIFHWIGMKFVRNIQEREFSVSVDIVILRLRYRGLTLSLCESWAPAAL